VNNGKIRLKIWEQKEMKELALEELVGDPAGG